ncbi:MAG TPA: hypothetical protein VGX78_07435 [Pirellulales bacterium]|jgi:hypothetical protein|nr:hypothetical protein [Pirellulales bacterium]
MNFSLRMLACVVGIPAGFLPLLAAIETGPAEVGVALAVLTVFGCAEAWRDDRRSEGRIWRSTTYRVARVAAAYATCGISGLLVAANTVEPEGPTAFQRLVFGDFGGHLRELGFSTTIMSFRLGAIWLCSLMSWIGAMAVVTRVRSALWLALGVAPLVCGGAWYESRVLGPAARISAALIVVGLPMLVAVRRRRNALRANPAAADRSTRNPGLLPTRPRSLSENRDAGGTPTPQRDFGIGSKHPMQFSVGALLGLVAICGLWSSITLYARREPRRQRFFVPLPVTGRVTCEGQGVVGAVVRFHPTEQTGRAAEGTTDSAGDFEVQMLTSEGRTVSGARVGEYIVTIAKGDPGVPRPAERALGETHLPPRYADAANSGLTATVEFGRANRFAFDLDAEAEP